MIVRLIVFNLPPLFVLIKNVIKTLRFEFCRFLILKLEFSALKIIIKLKQAFLLRLRS